MMKPAMTLATTLVMFSGVVPACLSAETVVVSLPNGRQITATIHERTNAAELWLEYGTRTVTVVRPVAWKTIVEASHQGEPISIPQLRELATRTVSEQPPAPASTRVVHVPPADESVRRETMAQRARRALGFVARVRSVQFDAALANWDGDVEADGLLLRLFPIDDQGGSVAASGTLRVEFIGRRQVEFNDARHHRGTALGEIGRWTAQVDEADFRRGVATVKLPFQASHPEFDVDWLADGLVHVRFTAPGHGTFEHSLDGVRTRPFSPLRDATQVQSGRRFLSTERTGRGKRTDRGE